jgi:glycosyltransferase involved in cell wall biosynthesis
MNILIIAHFFPPHKGGVETAAYNTAKRLALLGHTIVVLTSKSGNDKKNIQEREGFLIYRFKDYNLPELKGLPQTSSLGFMPKAIYKLPKIIRKHNIQLIHLQGRLFPISFITALLNVSIFKRPMILTVQGRLEIGLTGKIENIFDSIVTRFLYQRLLKIICVSDSLKKRLLKFKIRDKKLTVIPNGVDISVFQRNKSSRLLDQYLNGKGGIKKVLFVGRLDAQKGVKYLLKAIPLVLKKYKNVHFFILGNGNLEKELKNLANSLKINSNLTFIDSIPLEMMPEVYSSADIFCLPSLHEGFPLSIAEALSIGLIIVASATEGIPEAIKENENGLLCKPGDFNELAGKLIKALNLTNEEIECIRKNNTELAKSKYSWEIIVEKILKIYKSK